jgi:exodeoxyribonuclease V alpha subunit
MEEAINQAVRQLPERFSEVSEKLRGLRASTIHRLLGWTPTSRTRFVHHRDNPLPSDIVVVDEASMVNVVLMSRLLSALRPDARLVLVGDPDQLAPVEAGAVLADIVEHPSPPPSQLTQRLTSLGLPGSSYVVRLNTNHRFSDTLAALADAVLRADADRAVGLARDNGLLFADEAGSGLREQVVETGLAMTAAARAGDADAALAAMDVHRLLCGHRQGHYGVDWWTAKVMKWLAAADPLFNPQQHWYAGQPLLVGKNMPDTGLSNGDTGIVVANANQVADLAYFSRGGKHHAVSVFLLDEVRPGYAMTVHKAQGSQFEMVSLILPPPDSPLLNRELLYTAITRAKSKVTLIGSEEALRHAVENRAQRASGLAKRL